MATTTATRLADLPAEVIERVLCAALSPSDLAAANATARLFRGAPGGRSPVEHALRERARARGHAHALPAVLPARVCSWREELFARESVHVLARAHASPLAAGDGFSAFVDAEGGLHTCGEEAVLNNGWATGEYRTHVAIGHTESPDVRVPTRVASLAAVRICAVSAGLEHLLALSEAGAVYGCGSNNYGQLGLGDTEERRSFAPVRALHGAAVVGIMAGGYHSLALTAAGCAYSWGNNIYGQLGHGDTKVRLEPTRIEALDGVRVGGVAAGQLHTLLLAACGAVYSCGIANAGRLGHGDEQDQHTPRCIEALAGVRIVHVSAGSVHSLVVDAAGGVHSFGGGGGGALGHGVELRRPVPTRIEALGGMRAVRASAGYRTSAVLCADGSVHAFGNNSNGQLGLGPVPSAPSASAPAKALLPGRGASCAFGSYHALYATADGAVYACGQHSAELGLGKSRADDERDDLTTPTRIERLLPPVCTAGVDGEGAC